MTPQEVEYVQHSHPYTRNVSCEEVFGGFIVTGLKTYVQPDNSAAVVMQQTYRAVAASPEMASDLLTVFMLRGAWVEPDEPDVKLPEMPLFDRGEEELAGN